MSQQKQERGHREPVCRHGLRKQKTLHLIKTHIAHGEKVGAQLLAQLGPALGPVLGSAPMAPGIHKSDDGGMSPWVKKRTRRS
jgi:hypothetical protein